MGFDTGKSESPIIPLFIRDDVKALKLTQILLGEGIFVNPVVFSGSSEGRFPHQIPLMATHTNQQVMKLWKRLPKVAKTLNILV